MIRMLKIIRSYWRAFLRDRLKGREPVNMQKFTADFETTTDPDDCRVWAYGICEIGNPDNFIYGNSLDDFMNWCEYAGNPVLYFHNLGFDGEFIICWLFANGFTHVKDRDAATSRTFTTLISSKNMFYTMTVYFHVKGHATRKVTFLDSLKILPFSVAKVAKGFNLPISKLEIDYHEKRPIGHVLTPLELDYLRNDVAIMAMALKVIFDQGMTKMTAGSNAFSNYKKGMKWFEFNHLFPVPDYDADIRQAYRGGYTYLAPRYREKDIGTGIVLDVNSLYPSVMRNKPLPYGEGKAFTGQYKPDGLYKLFVQFLRCHFELKPGKLPMIQIKHDLRFNPTEYIENSLGFDLVLCLTSVDLKLFLENYAVYNVEYLGGWAFKSKRGLFDDYIDHWSKVKIEAKESKNYAMYTLSKLMLNSLYGKFATNPDCRGKVPLNDHGVVHYVLGEPEYKEPIYIPVGAFVTAWARDTTIRAAGLLYDRFIYADTDSLHLEGPDLPACLEIDDTCLGAWKHESTFKRARYIKQKTYIEEDEHGLKVTCAGMPSTCYPHVTWDNFHTGTSYPGKLKTTHVRGGIVLKEVPYTITGGIDAGSRQMKCTKNIQT